MTKRGTLKWWVYLALVSVMLLGGCKRSAPELIQQTRQATGHPPEGEGCPSYCGDYSCDAEFNCYESCQDDLGCGPMALCNLSTQTCEPAFTGECGLYALEDGYCYSDCRRDEMCAAGAYCAEDLTCKRDLCIGKQVDDGRGCTEDACNRDTGVVTHTPYTQTLHCWDSSYCDGMGTCNSAGDCVDGTANPPPINDNNPCTQDICDPIAESITHPPVVIDDDNPCTIDSCTPTGGLSHLPAAQGTSCENANLCDGHETCNADGVCSHVIGSEPILTDGNPCTFDYCDQLTGVHNDPRPANFSCTDGDLCNGDEKCDGNKHCHEGIPLQVPDTNPCTIDSCSATGGVTHVAAPLNSPCEDGNQCNGHETCSANAECRAGQSPSFDDGNTCTLDGCNPATGDTHTPLAQGTSCSDANPCNGEEACDDGGNCELAVPAPNLNDDNPCTADSCSAALGVQHLAVSAGVACDDSTVCNGHEQCDGAKHCVLGTALPQDDNNPCTIDSCDPIAGVKHTSAEGLACDDGKACTTADSCRASQCVGQPIVCTASDFCNVAACNASTGQCQETPKPDGTSCVSNDACVVNTSCTAGHCSGTPTNVDDQDPCTTDLCDPITGPSHPRAPVNTPCGDNVFCNGQEVCNAAGACVAGSSPELSDGNPCTQDVCNNTTAKVDHLPLASGTSCDDATVCNGREHCDADGVCVAGMQLTVDDANPCTADACDPVRGVSNTKLLMGSACDDATVCNGRETCDASGNCVLGSPLLGNDGNPCTTDNCDPALGVTNTPLAVNSSCSDGNACNGDERCDASGKCALGTPLIVEDDKPCTRDTCDPATGAIAHNPLPGGASCANGDLCDGAETCDGNGVCKVGVSLTIDDGDACTVDSCAPLSGVKHVRDTSGSCVTPGRWETLIASQPSPRDGAAGTFTSAGELFVFGGENAGAGLADTWLWSAARNGWRRGASGPSTRIGAGVAFDSQRQRVIVFGGVSNASAGADYFGDVWEYSPVTDSWASRNAATPPPGRAMAAFAYDTQTQRGLLFGGVGATHLADTWQWDATSGAWTLIGGQGPSARFGAAFAFDPGHGVFVLFGGSPQGVSGGSRDDTWTFNEGTGVWSPRSPATKPPPRAGASMTFDASASRLVMVGGTSAEGLNLTDAWEFDVSTDTWTPLVSTSNTPAVTAAIAGFDPVTGQVLAATGLSYSDSGRFTTDASAIWSYSRPEQRWVPRSASTAPARLDLAAAFNSNTGSVVARATLGSSDTSTRPMMWDYDGATRQWRATDASAAETDFSNGAFKEGAIVSNFLLYDNNRNLTLRVAAAPTTSSGYGFVRTAEWNGARWRAGCNVYATETLDVGVANGSAIYDPPRRRVLLFGSGRILALDAATCATTLIQVAGPSARDFPSVGWDSERDIFVAFGGGPLTDTWEFDPRSNAWTSLPAAGPSARTGAAVAYDSVRKKLLLYGGALTSSTFKRDTWEYSVASHAWSLLNAAGGPDDGRARVVFDSVRKQPLLVGMNGSIWSWDGATWQQTVNSVAPSARSGMSGGWVPSLGAALMFGGTSGDGRRAFLNDLWLWSGGWRQISPPGANTAPLLWGASWQPSSGGRVAAAGPVARTGHVLATGLADVGLLFGGEGDGGLLGDTWLIDATTLQWSFQQTPVAPSPRTGHAIAVATNGYVLFGGLSHPSGGADTLANDSWFWSGSAWSPMPLSGTPPSPRYGHAIATDEANHVVILFGGRDASGVVGDTWLLNLDTLQSSGWQKLTPANSPLPRFGHAMSFDVTRGRIVLSGGAGAQPSQSFSDTWEWDVMGATWVKRNAALTDARVGHAEFYDRNLQQTLAFGGFVYDATGQAARTHGDTLAFTGATQTDPPTTRANGDKCTTGSVCTSGACVDGVCCNTSCTSQCAACDVPGYQGTCIATTGVPRGARPSCGGAGGECGSACNGADMTACHLAQTGTSCGPAVGCSGGFLVESPGVCNGSGACSQTLTSCLPYACNANNPGYSCLHNCSMDIQCFSSDYRCSASDSYGTCFERAKILSLSASAPLKVGVPLTITVQGSRAGATYLFRFLNAAAGPFQYPCAFDYIGNATNTMTCTFTPAAADIGNGKVDVFSKAPGTILGGDDQKTVQLAIGAP